jgi:hypothetical protein
MRGGLTEKIQVFEWAKSWQSLNPGESLSVSYSRRNLFNFQEDAGDYEFWGKYVPPKLTIEEISLLERAGINFPRVTLATAHLNAVVDVSGCHNDGRRTGYRSFLAINPYNTQTLSMSANASLRQLTLVSGLPIIRLYAGNQSAGGDFFSMWSNTRSSFLREHGSRRRRSRSYLTGGMN